MERPGSGHAHEGKASLALKREPLSAQASERLRTLIRTGEFTPGTRLVELDLADLLGVSRGPIREALRNLDREGLVVISPSKGAVVAEWRNQDLLDLYDVRTPLELKAIELTTRRAAEACIRDLDMLLVRWETASQAGERERCAEIDYDFHRIIWRHATNRFLEASLGQTIHPIETIFYLNAFRYDDLVEVFALHRQIRDAIASGRVTTARKAMEAHMDNSLAKARRHSEGLSV